MMTRYNTGDKFGRSQDKRLSCLPICASFYTTDPARARSMIGCSGHNGNNRPASPTLPLETRAYRKVLESVGKL